MPARTWVTGGLALLLSACGQSSAPTAAPARTAAPTTPTTLAPSSPPPATTPAPDAYPAYAVTAQVPVIAVHASAGGPVVAQLSNPRPSGATLTFLLHRQQAGWLEVFLPTRPNDSQGWVSASDVTLHGLAYRLDVHVDAHRLDLFAYGRLLRSFPVGVGRQATPTPGGTFYLVELLRPPSPNGAYGPYAYGLSGHSTTLQSFAGADAVIGLHGTNDPASVGHDVSHGCLRMHNADISYLAGLLPLGTPVRILH